MPPIEMLELGSCAALTRCLAGRGTGGADLGTIEAAVYCEPPVLASGAGVAAAAAVVAAALDVDGPSAHGAYLFLSVDGGWCPADELLPPTWDHGGYCETRFDTNWQAAAGQQDAELAVSAERICHLPLDQEELAAGESDVALIECRRTTHRLDGDRLILLSELDSDGPCDMR
jgi:hypothetical protein